MASKDGDFRLSQRQEARYKRFDKQLESILQDHLARIKGIEKEWELFKGQNTKAFKLYRQSEEARSKDPKYPLNVNESANWTLISDKLEQKGNKIVEESDRYKRQHKLLEEEKKEFYDNCVKEWQRQKEGKGLYDTDSDSDTPQPDRSDHNQYIHLVDEEKVRLERDIRYLTQQLIALGDLHSDFIRERNRYPKDSYDFALLDREKSKVDRIVKVYEKKLRTRNRILQGELHSQYILSLKILMVDILK